MALEQLLRLSVVAILSFALSYVGAAVGLVLGQFRVVMLTYVLGGAGAAVATSLVVSTAATVVGSVGHARSGRVRLVPLLMIGVPSAASAYLVTRWVHQLDARVVKLGIALALLATAFQMLARRRTSIPPAATLAAPRPAVVALLQILVGAILGAVSGLVGLLLGSLRLPAMLRLGVTPATAVGTNMAIGALTGTFAGLSAVVGGQVNLGALVVVAPVTLLGAHLGAKRTGTMSAQSLTRWIALALIPTALFMIGEILVRLRH